MKSLIKTLALVTAGLTVGVAVGRVSKKNLNGEYTVMEDDLSLSTLKIDGDKITKYSPYFKNYFYVLKKPKQSR